MTPNEDIFFLVDGEFRWNADYLPRIGEEVVLRDRNAAPIMYRVDRIVNVYKPLHSSGYSFNLLIDHWNVFLVPVATND